MNLPNKLTVIRMCMVPVVIALIMLAGIIPPALAYLLAAAVFSLASLTDMLDGRIARKYNLITDFGRFLDPLADKFMVIGTMLCLLYKMGSAACGVPRAHGDGIAAGGRIVKRKGHCGQ